MACPAGCVFDRRRCNFTRLRTLLASRRPGKAWRTSGRGRFEDDCTQYNGPRFRDEWWLVLKVQKVDARKSHCDGCLVASAIRCSRGRRWLQGAGWGSTEHIGLSVAGVGCGWAVQRRHSNQVQKAKQMDGSMAGWQEKSVKRRVTRPSPIEGENQREPWKRGEVMVCGCSAVRKREWLAAKGGRGWVAAPRRVSSLVMAFFFFFSFVFSSTVFDCNVCMPVVESGLMEGQRAMRNLSCVVWRP
ncbi:hypothetical protein HDK77DRAFT_15423 [Phyllosticta capitalensis]